MIRFRDASTLALTKLRTRKVRLIITVVVSGLLFTLLAGSSLVARGAFSSVESFSDEGFGKRYIVSGYAQQNFDFMQNEEIITRALQIHKELVARKTAEAKRLKIQYEPTSDSVPVQEGGGFNGDQKFLDVSSPAAIQAIKEYSANLQVYGLEEMKEIARPYNASKYYESKSPSYMQNGRSLKVLKDGKEKFDQAGDKMYGPPRGVDSIAQMWQSASKGLLEPFTLPGQNLEKSDDGAVPIIVPMSAAEELLGLETQPQSTPAHEKLDRIKDVRSRAHTVTFEVCVRNDASSQLINQALSVQQEIETNKNNKDYRRPSLMYGLPDVGCASAPVIRDVRTAEEKAYANRQAEFERIFGRQDPEQQKIAFRVVGVVPDFEMSAASSVGQIVMSLVTSSLGTGWYTPTEYVEANPILANLFMAEKTDVYAAPSYYAEFSDANNARAFMDEASCNPDFGSMEAGGDPFKKCAEEGKFFSLSAYGSNSLGLESAKRGFGKVFRYAALGIALVAAIIMMGTVGRMIADSRRETAVFRAIGAKKLDIASVYLLYTIMLSILICVFAILCGVIIATVLHSRYAEELTVQALVAYNAQDLSRDFHLYAFYWPDMLQLTSLALLGGVVSAVFPLVRNLRRNPIRDMRDDT